ncbi:MAG: 3-hydroxyisobutyrate dehydrogenase, partial [Methyloligellaceae bacterium]
MSDIGFIGLGNMGGPMASNLIQAGHRLKVYDVIEDAVSALVSSGAEAADSPGLAARDVDFVISMLPAGQHVREVYLGEGAVISNSRDGTLLLDCSTIDVATAREVSQAAKDKGLEMLDAPVSGGVTGAAAGTLTFMVGGEDSAFAKAHPILQKMGKNIVHAGGAGNGQAAKMCNNLILAISMIGTCEAFVLAESVGLSHEKLYEISSTASGQSWSLTSYCPVPGPVPSSPANRNYEAGFTAAMMLKDLRLAEEAASQGAVNSPLGNRA